MQATATIFNAQFTELPQMKSSFLFQKPQSVPKTTDGHIQIHHVPGHWVVSHLRQDEVYIYDSLNPTTISDELQKQMLHLYLNQPSTLAVYIVHVHKQPNLVNCRVIAIANATVLVSGEAPEELLMYTTRER